MGAVCGHVRPSFTAVTFQPLGSGQNPSPKANIKPNHPLGSVSGGSMCGEGSVQAPRSSQLPGTGRGTIGGCHARPAVCLSSVALGWLWRYLLPRQHPCQDCHVGTSIARRPARRGRSPPRCPCCLRRPAGGQRNGLVPWSRAPVARRAAW